MAKVIGGFDDGANVLFIVGTAFLGIGTVLAVVFGWGVPTDLRIDANKKEVEGIVERVVVDPSTRINRKAATRIYYRFQLATKIYQEDHATIDPEMIARYGVDAPVPIEFNANDPAESRIKGTERAFFGLFWAIFTLFFPVLGLVIVGLAAKMRWARRAAYRDGLAVAAKVQRRGRQAGFRANEHELTYAFEVDGTWYGGRLTAKRDEDLPPAKEGELIAVVHHPTKPGINFAYVD